MRTEYDTLSQRQSIMESGRSSRITILRPRELSFQRGSSSILSAFANFDDIEPESWLQRAKLILTILSFCLGPCNIWRFPEQSFIHGNATFIYLYIFYTWALCVSLLLFEISLSQYFVKGFAKIFTIYPIMEGITLSMKLYSVIATLLYSLICTYSFMYAISSLQEVMPHSFCSERIKDFGCEENSTNETSMPEYVYFYGYVERALSKYNWRNVLLIALTWTLLCLIILFAILRHKMVAAMLSVFIFLTLLYTAVICSFVKGANNGLKRMFIPNTGDVRDPSIWIYSAEQSIVTLSVGAGPLTTIWSLSTVKHWSQLDCLIVNTVSFFGSLLAGIVFFSAGGVLALKKNTTIESISDTPEHANTFVLVTHLFNSLDDGVSHFTSCLYYLMLSASCLYSLLQYTQIILLYIGSYITTTKVLRVKIIICACFLLFCFTGNIGVSTIGYPLIMSINKIFIPTALLIILCFQSLSVSYLYGLTNFCDDIDFMNGFVPNYYYQATWLLLPALFALFSVSSLYLKFCNIQNPYDLLVLCLTILFTLLPIITFAIYKCYVGIKAVGIRRVLDPRLPETDSDLSGDEFQLNNISRFSTSDKAHKTERSSARPSRY